MLVLESICNYSYSSIRSRSSSETNGECGMPLLEASVYFLIIV